MTARFIRCRATRPSGSSRQASALECETAMPYEKRSPRANKKEKSKYWWGVGRAHCKHTRKRDKTKLKSAPREDGLTHSTIRATTKHLLNPHTQRAAGKNNFGRGRTPTLKRDPWLSAEPTQYQRLHFSTQTPT